MNRELQSILLTENEDNLKKLDNYFSDDYKSTLLSMFTVLVDAIKTKPIYDINLILSNIETVLLEQDASKDKMIIDAVRDANNRINNIKSVKENRELKNIKFRLVDINRKINEKKDKEDNNALYNLYNYLIFEERNIDLIVSLLESERNILSKKDLDNNNILYNVIDYFTSLKEDDPLVKYYYDVIVLFLESEEESIIKSEKNIYLDLLNRKHARSRKHVKDIISRFDDFNKVNSKKLEKRYQIHRKFHDSIYGELELLKYDTNGRRIIDENFITIDGLNSLCLDDAICIKKNKDGSFYNYVAISDVASFIPYQSELYYEGLHREESLYLIDDVISLYPSIISNNYCSLLPNKNRNVIIYKMFVDPYYNVDMDSLEIIKGVIKSNLKLDYETANHGMGLDSEVIEMLNNLALLSLKLRSENSIKEKYRKIENLVRNDARYHQSFYVDTSISANIIQEEMLLVNHLAPLYFEKRGLVYLYRNHQVKTDKFINNEIHRLFNLSHVREDVMNYDKIFSLLKECYLTADYSSVNYGHVGLGYECYSHSSAAARRIADYYNQYLTYEQVFNNNISLSNIDRLFDDATTVANIINDRKKDNDKFISEYNSLYSKKLIRKK